MSNYSKLIKKAHGGTVDSMEFIPKPNAQQAPMSAEKTKRLQLLNQYNALHNEEVSKYLGTLAGVTGARFGMSWSHPIVASIAERFGDRGKWLAERLRRTSNNRTLGDAALQTLVGGLGGLVGGGLGMGVSSLLVNARDSLGSGYSNIANKISGRTPATRFEDMFKGMTNDQIEQYLNNTKQYIKKRYNLLNGTLSSLVGGTAAAGMAGLYDHIHGSDKRTWGDWALRTALQTGAGMLAANTALMGSGALTSSNRNTMPNKYYDPLDPNEQLISARIGRFLNNKVLSAIPGWYLGHKDYVELPDNMRNASPEELIKYDLRQSNKNRVHMSNNLGLKIFNRKARNGAATVGKAINNGVKATANGIGAAIGGVKSVAGTINDALSRENLLPRN